MSQKIVTGQEKNRYHLGFFLPTKIIWRLTKLIIYHLLKKYENQFWVIMMSCTLSSSTRPHLRFEHKGLLIFDQDKNIIIEKHYERP